jgi:hypothetical protein
MSYNFLSHLKMPLNGAKIQVNKCKNINKINGLQYNSAMIMRVKTESSIGSFE